MEPEAGPTTKEAAKEKMSLQRQWASEPATSTFADRQSLPSGASGGLAPQQKYGFTGNSAAVRPLGGPAAQDPPGPFAQGFPRGYSYQLGQPYPQHPQSERLLSGAKPQPGLEPHAWPFAGQLPSEELYSVGRPVHAHPHGLASGRFPRQKSPSLPSSFEKYPQSGSEPAEEGYSKKEQKAKKPGRYICHYCGRACAKPSVLKKHIRSHTGERPYPCIPCGFSFKTKSNLYKHRKSHAHAIKAGLVPFTELAVARSGDMEQASPLGESEVHSDGEQSTDTDEEGMDGSTLLVDQDSPLPHLCCGPDRSAGGAEPAYADSAEELPVGSIKVPILIVPKPGGVPSAGTEGAKASHHMLASQAGRAHSLEDSPTIKQRLALRLNDKKGQDLDSVLSQSLHLLSPHSKGSTDSGYFSRSESAEQQISPPNTNIKTYEEIMFGRTWYYRPNSRSKQSITVGAAGAGPSALASFKPAGNALLEMAPLGEDQVRFRGDLGVCGEAKQHPTGPCQSSTGLLEPPSESGLLLRTNSLPSSSPSSLSVPAGMRGSHSFDEMMTSNDVFYPARRLTRQTAFEHPASEAHVVEVVEAEAYGHVPKSGASSLGMKMAERSPAAPEHAAFGLLASKVSLSELASRKRRKEKSVGEEEDSPGQSHSASVELLGDSEWKQGSVDGWRATPTGRGSLHSAHSQSDSFDTCASTCSEDLALFADSEGRKSGGNVISVIQHTNSLSRPSSFDKSESLEQPGPGPGPGPDKGLSSQVSEQSDSDIFEDAPSPEAALLRSEGWEPPAQGAGEHASLSSASTAALPGQTYHIPHKLVRQPNIQVPEIRVTEEPDKPDRDAEVPLSKEPEKQQVEDFQLPQRSDTLSQMPAEKLPPKKKRLRLTDMEHSSGESSFESTCTSLSRSPSQESNLSHSSSFSMSFDRDEGLKCVSPSRQEDAASLSAPKQSEFLTVPGSAHASHQQQREMRRSSSEQAPCTLSTELPDMRSKSFDCGSLPSSRQGELYCSASAMKERRRGYLVRQPSLSVYPEAVPQEPGLSELSKPERLDHGTRHAPAEPPHGSGEPSCRARRGASSTGGGTHPQHQQPFLQQSMSEDSLQEEPPHSSSSRGQQPRLQAQGSSSEGEHPGHELMKKELIQQPHSGSSYPSFQQTGLVWSQEVSQTGRQQQPGLHMRSAGSKHVHHALAGRAEPPGSQLYSAPVLLQQLQPVFAGQTPGSQPSLPGLLVPVRIQTHVPALGSVMYTSVSQLGATQGSWPQGPAPVRASGPGAGSGRGFNLLHFLAQTEAAASCHQQLQTGIPLSLTSGTISTSDASGSGAGAAKRVLSPASSLERFIQSKQQKRVKEERMYGQIVKELSAVELGGGGPGQEQAHLQPPASLDACERMSSSPPLSFLPAAAAASVAVPVRSSAPRLPDVPRAESFTPPLQIVTERSPLSPAAPPAEGVEAEPGSSPRPSMTSVQDRADSSQQEVLGGAPVSVLLQRAGPGLLLTDLAEAPQLRPFASLRSSSRVSWCFLNYSKPASSPAGVHGSVYSCWCVSAHNPNPLKLSTKAALALLRSKQRRSSELIYTPAAISPPSCGQLVSSAAWRRSLEQVGPAHAQLKPELLTLDGAPFGRKMKGVASWERSKEETEEKQMAVKQPSSEPTRIKIFEGGYKSNEDYVYVRGRGRGKYICEECGIRCKKPSMLKKHIRTHTDVRPYVCKFCNFAFKTKGNLTKHMKSKAHMKKCLELGVSMSSVEDNEADEGEAGEEGRAGEASSRGALTEHQFSDAEDSEGAEEEGDDVDDEEDDEEDYEGDSTPRTRSRSTSPYSPPSVSISAVGSSQPPPHLASDLLASSSKPPLFAYFPTLPSIQITAQAPPTGPEDGDVPVPSPDLSSSSSPVSPSSSPLAQRYLSPHRDAHAGRLSPRRELSPLRHISPKRDLGVAGGYRRDLSPRRGPLSLLSPTGRDYKREVSPRGRHRGLVRAVSPRRGLHHHQHHHLRHHSPQSRSRSVRAAPQDPEPDVEMEHHPDLLLPRKQDSPPQQVLFSHLPLHSQKQVRSPFPLIPIGGIQMVHALTPLSQQGAPLAAHLELSEGSASAEATPPQARAGGDSGGRGPWSEEGGGARLEEESIHTCTKAIASLCIHSEVRPQPGGRGAAASSSPPALSSDPQPHHSSPPPLSPSPPQHFTGRELRPPPPSASVCPHPPSPRSEAPHQPSNPPRPERDGEEESRRPLAAAP